MRSGVRKHYMKQHQFVSQLALIMKQSQIPIEKHDLDKDKAHFLDRTHKGVIGALQVLSPEKLLQNPQSTSYPKKPCSFQMYD